MAQNGDPLEDARGFMKSRVILTGAELDFFTRIDEKPSTAAELADAAGLDVRAAARVLDCLVTFGLLRKEEERYSLTPESASFSSLHPESVLPMLLHMNGLWDRWSGLTEAVRQGKGRDREDGNMWDEKETKAFIGAMHVVGRGLSREIASAANLGRFKRLLDIGGGSGTYTVAFLAKNPEMRAVIFDLESVIPMAKERLETEGLLGRVDLKSGDFYEDELPGGCDLALLSAIIHQNSLEENEALFRKICRALEPGGTILIRDHIMDEDRTYPPAGATFALNMLVNTRGGDTYTFREVREALERAGFTDVRLVRAGERMDSLVEACRPA